MKTAEHAAQLASALDRAESFIAGFEDDETQEGIPEMLEDIRAALSAWDKHNAPDYETRVRAYEAEGMTRSDAQAVADAEDIKARA